MTKNPSPSRRRRALALAGLTAALAALLVSLALPATALASPCGDKVLADWFDNGRIDKIYALPCYEDAIDSIPSDLRDYANAEEVISRALQHAVDGRLDPREYPDPSPEGSPPLNGGGGSGGNPSDPNAPGGGSEAAPDVDTSGISSVPIPLIILALMSVALLTAGGLGYLRRRHATADAGDERPGPDEIL